jgi:hypothetical protein
LAGASDDFFQSGVALDQDMCPTSLIPTNAFILFQGHLPTKRFFDDLKQLSFGAAVEGVVARSCYLDTRIRTAADPGISNTDLILFFRIARLVFQLGPKPQHLLGGVLSRLETRYLPLTTATVTHSSSDHLQLPTTHKAFIAKLLNQTNTNSLTSIIPVPPTRALPGKHAYVSIPALIAYELGFANACVDPLYNAKYERLVNSEQGQALFRQAKCKLLADISNINGTHAAHVPLVVLLLMWFYGWDPNGSSKGNRSPVWSAARSPWFLSICKVLLFLLPHTCLPLVPGRPTMMLYLQRLFQICGHFRRHW